MTAGSVPQAKSHYFEGLRNTEEKRPKFLDCKNIAFHLCTSICVYISVKTIFYSYRSLLMRATSEHDDGGGDVGVGILGVGIWG